MNLFLPRLRELLAESGNTKKQAFAYILAKACIFWCGRQELKQLNKSENGGFLRENGQKRLVFLILPVRSPWAKSIF